MKGKTFVQLMLLVAALGGLSFQALASEWNFMIGAQYWMPEWSYENKGTGYNPTSDPESFMGPVASIGYGKFKLGIQYATGEWEFDDSIKQEREDMDIYVTYSFFEYFTAMIGYKNMEFNKKYTAGANQGIKYTTKLHGLGYGLGFGTYFGESNVFIRANGYYMPSLTGDKNYTDAPPEYAGDADGDGYTAEAIVGYTWRFTEKAAMNFGLGYKIQSMAIDYGTSSGGYTWYDLDEDLKGFKAEVTVLL